MNIAKKLIINGWVVPISTAHLPDRKKVYIKSPERSGTGQMSFGDKIIVPYFTETWNSMKIEDYTKLKSLVERDENIVYYYDASSDVYATAKFAIQQPKYKSLYYDRNGIDGVTIEGVLELEMVFDGTLNDINKITIEFNKNKDTATGTTPSSITGWIGQEFELPTSDTLTDTNYKINSWNTKVDGTGIKHLLGDTIALAQNMTLYADWVVNDIFTLSYNYGVGTVALDAQNEPTYSKPVNYNSVIGTLPVTAPKNIEYKGVTIPEPYNFLGWFALQDGLGSQYIATTVYSIQGNISIYAYFEPQEFTISFNSNDGNYTPTSITQGYKTNIYKPYDPIKTGFNFDGWYLDSELSSSFSWTVMPPENTTLYAKWS